MTDHPLDLRPHEVRAALDGRLSLIVRPLEPIKAHNSTWPIYSDNRKIGTLYGLPSLDSQRVEVGDKFWGREAWRVGAWHYNNSEVALDYVDGPRKEWLHVDDPDQLHRLIDQSREDARAACIKLSTKNYYEYTWLPGRGPTRWRSSITMPRWASRLTLTVSDVDVKRVQEIGEEEAEATGIRNAQAGGPWGNEGLLEDFENLWNATHGPDAWDRNPWCAFCSVTVRPTNIDMEG